MASECYDNAHALGRPVGNLLLVLPQQRVLLGVASLRAVHVARFIQCAGRQYCDGYGKEWQMGVSR